MATRTREARTHKEERSWLERVARADCRSAPAWSGGALVAVLLAIFIFQNTGEETVEIFFWDFTGPMWVILSAPRSSPSCSRRMFIRRPSALTALRRGVHYPGGVSTRRLILAALLCGMAILVAFTVQVVIATR
jgi:hypothetical protein